MAVAFGGVVLDDFPDLERVTIFVKLKTKTAV